MTAVTHSLGGITIAVFLAETCPGTYTEQGMLIGAAVIGSLLPDIDHPNSYISNRVKGLRAGVGFLQWIMRLMANLMPVQAGNQVRSMAAHRGLAHSLLFAVLVSVLAGMIHVRYAMGMTVGILSHLILDIFSSGVPLFLPVLAKRICLTRIKTGGMVEWGIRALWLLVLSGLLLKKMQG